MRSTSTDLDDSYRIPIDTYVGELGHQGRMMADHYPPTTLPSLFGRVLVAAARAYLECLHKGTSEPLEHLADCIGGADAGPPRRG